MKKTSLFVTVVLVLSLLFPAYSFADVTDEKNMTGDYLSLADYFELTDEKLIFFNSDEAIFDGFDEDLVELVGDRIIEMNSLVIAGFAYITEDFAAVIEVPSINRAIGESKVVNYWYGLTEVYLNTDDVDALLDGLSAFSDVITAATMLTYISNTTGLSHILTTISLSTLVYKSEIGYYAGFNRGIIMCMQAVEGVDSVWFMSQ